MMEVRNSWLFQVGVFFFVWVGSIDVSVGQREIGRDWQGAMQDAIAERDLEKRLVKLERLRLHYVEEVGADGAFYGHLSHVTATALGQSGRFAEAFAVFDEALTAHRRPNSEDPSLLVNSYYNAAHFNLKVGSIDEFRAYADSCIHFSEVFPEKRYIGIHAYEQLAIYFYDIGEYNNSLRYAELGIQAAEKEDRYVGLLYLQSAQARLALPDPEGTYEKAKAALEKSRALLKDDPGLQGLVESVEAQYELTLGSPKDARDKYENAIQLYFREKDYEGAVRNLLKLGDLFSEELGDFDASKRVYREGLKALDRVNRIDLRPRILNGLAKQMVNAGDFDTGISHLYEALDGLRVDQPAYPRSSAGEGSGDSFSNDLLAGMLFGNLGKAFASKFASTGDTTELRTALSHFKSFIEVSDRVRWSHEYDQSKLYWREQGKETFTQALDVCYRLNDAESAYQVFEKSRAVMLQDRLNDLEARRFLSDAENDREKQLRIEVASLTQRLNLTGEGMDGYPEAQAKLVRQREAYRSYIKSLESKYPQYVEAKYGASVRPLYELRQLLKEGEHSYVAYFNGVADELGDPYIYALVINPESTRFVKTPMAQYKERADRFLELSSSKELLNRNFGEFISLGHGLYQQMVEPLGSLNERLIVSPDDRLLPIDLLVKDLSSTGSFLLYDHAVSYTYSAGLLGKGHRESLAVKPTLLGFAPVSYQDHLQLPTLAGADFSLNKLNSFLSGCEFFVQTDATKGRFMEKINNHAMVVLYTHAEADTANQDAYLYFHDEKLKVSDLQFLDALPTELIILSACNTGTGANRPGEGVFSLARGFAAAGIPTSVTTLWEIDSRATYSLTENFYQQVVQGIPMDEALRQAKLMMLQGDDRMQALPYFWGGSIVLGNVQPLTNEKNWGNRLRYGMVGILFILAVVVYWVRASKKDRSRSSF